MFAYPPSTRFGKAVPKTRIHAAASSNKRLRELFTAQVADIVWSYKLSPETLHLPVRHGIAEIQVFSLHLKSPQLDPAILRTLDRAIPFPLLVEIHHGEFIRFAATYKRPSEADAAKWVIEASFLLDWQVADTPRLPLPVALDLASLHDQLIRHHIGIPARPNESLRDHVSRVQAIATKQREAKQLEARLQRERQFNRKVELNQQLRVLSAELADLGLRQPAAAFPEPACWPGSQSPAQEKPISSSFTTHSLPAAGYGDESGSRLPHSMS
jgi:hypothetical protein